jgi:hypothetical protein
MDEEKPPVRRLALKPKDVVPTEVAARPGDGTAISVDLIHRQNQIAAARGKLPASPENDPFAEASDLFRPKPAAPPPSQGTEPGVSIEGMLRQNLEAAKDTEPELIAMPAPRKSRRRRDFALVLACAAASAGVLSLVFRHDLQMVGLGMFIIVFSTVICAWIMYGVMDRY